MPDAYVIGYPPQCTIDGTDIYWPAGEWDLPVMTRQFAVGDKIGNVTRVSGAIIPTATISAIGGEQADGTYKMTVSSLPSGWQDGDRCTPLTGSAANWYTTMSGAGAVMSEGDTAYIWYADESDTEWYTSGFGDVPINAFGMLKNQRVYVSGACWCSTDGLDFSSHLIWENVTVKSNAQPVKPRTNNCTGGDGTASIIVRRCRFSSETDTSYNNIRPYGSTDNYITIEWCLIDYNSAAVYNSAGRWLIQRNCTFARTGYGIYQGYHGQGHFYNLYFHYVNSPMNKTGWENELDHFAGLNKDFTGWGTGSLAAQTFDDLDLATPLDTNYPLPFPRSGGNSSLLDAGKDVSGTHYDLFGREVTAGNFPIGCALGIDLSPASTDPGESNVLAPITYKINGVDKTGTYSPDFPDAGNVIEGDTVNGSPGTYHEATTAEVQLGVTFGPSQTYTGTYDPAGSPPDAPTITAATAGDAQVTLTIDAADAADVVYARYRYLQSDGTWTAWSAESASWKRTGDGDITITGLTNDTLYQFSAYAKSGNLTSDWSVPAYATPTDGTNAATGPINTLIETARDMIAATSTWQTWTGEAEAAARLHTYNGGIDNPSGTDRDQFLYDARPTIVAWIEDEFSAIKTATGSRDVYGYGATIYLGLDANYPSGYGDDDTVEDGEKWFNRMVGSLIDDLLAKSGTIGSLTIREAQITEGPVTIDKGALIPSAGADPIQDVYQHVTIALQCGGEE